MTRRVARALRIGFVVLAVGLVGVALGLVWLTETEGGREVLRARLVEHASAGHRGRVTLGELAEAGVDRWVLRDYRALTADGVEVMHTPELVAHLDVGALFGGVVRFRPAVFRGATIRLADDTDGQVSLVRALEVPDDRAWVPLHFDDVRIEHNTIHVDLPGQPAITLRDVNGLVTLHLGHVFSWRMSRHEGVAVLGPLEPRFSDMRGRLQSDHAHPLIVEMVLDVEVAEPGARFDYHVPAVVGERGEPGFSLTLPVDVPRAGDDE